MDAHDFARAVLQHFSAAAIGVAISMETEGPIAQGHVVLTDSTFVRVYYNAETGTIAYALVSRDTRIWGIDCDNRRGWHRHPASDPSAHVAVAPMTVEQVVSELKAVLKDLNLV